MKIWAVNTNVSNLVGERGADIVLNQNRVVVWYRNCLKHISQGDLILSFNNNKNIIAVGYAISEVKCYTEKYQNGTEEMWIDVDWIWKCKIELSPPTEELSPPDDIKKICDRYDRYVNRIKLINPIKTDDIEKTNNRIKTFREICLDWTNNIDTFKLLEEIGKRKI